MAARRRSEEDDGVPVRSRRGRKKSIGALPVILIVLVGFILFCGGFAALIYFVVIGPKVDMARRVERDIKQEEAEAKVSKSKLNQLRAGMTRAQV